MSPTQRTLKRLRADGYEAEVVEKWIPGANIRRDLFGIIDIVAIRGRETLGVQTTTLSNLGARLKKMGEAAVVPKLRDAGWTLQAWGWRKLRSGWEAKVVNVS